MRTKKVIVVAALAALPLTAARGNAPEKVWVCHFPDHDAGQTWGVGYDGDYVLTTQPAEGEEPTQVQVNWCDSHGGGHIIHIPVTAAYNGHEAQ